LLDIDRIYSAYQAVAKGNSLKEKEDARTFMKLLRALYEKVSFRSLDRLERPFIFAYSAMVNDNVTS